MLQPMTIHHHHHQTLTGLHQSQQTNTAFNRLVHNISEHIDPSQHVTKYTLGHHYIPQKYGVNEVNGPPLFRAGSIDPRSKNGGQQTPTFRVGVTQWCLSPHSDPVTRGCDHVPLGVHPWPPLQARAVHACHWRPTSNTSHSLWLYPSSLSFKMSHLLTQNLATAALTAAITDNRCTHEMEQNLKTQQNI